MTNATMNAAGTAHPAPDTITGTLNNIAVIGAAAVAMQKNNAGNPSESRLSTVLGLPSGVSTSTDSRSTDTLIGQPFDPLPPIGK